MIPITPENIGIAISLIIAIAILTNAIMLYFLVRQNIKHNARIKQPIKTPQAPTIHSIIAQEWPGDYQEAEIDFENDETEELIVRSDENGLFLYRSHGDTTDPQPQGKEFRTMQDFIEEDVTEIVVTFTYMINLLDQTNDS